MKKLRLTDTTIQPMQLILTQNTFQNLRYFNSLFNQCGRGECASVEKSGVRTPGLGHCKCFDISTEENQEPLKVLSRGSIPCELHCKMFILAAVLNGLRGLRVKAGRSVRGYCRNPGYRGGSSDQGDCSGSSEQKDIF